MKKLLQTLSLALAFGVLSSLPLSACEPASELPVAPELSSPRPVEPEENGLQPEGNGLRPEETPTQPGGNQPQPELSSPRPVEPEENELQPEPEESGLQPEEPPTQPGESQSQTNQPGETQPQPTQPGENQPQTNQPSQPEKALEARYIEVLVDGLNVRSGAGTGYSSLGQVEKGVLLGLKGKTGDWYMTLYRGRTAYVSARESYTRTLALEGSDEAVEKVIEEGLRRLGTPYVYGATRYHDGRGALLKGFTAEEFDCSSLMQYIFYQGAGIELDVTTRTQIKQGKHVSKSEIARGDLLFFTNDSRCDRTGIERVGHVALYLGENYILHTASDYAKIEQITPKRWGYFLEARRMF